MDAIWRGHKLTPSEYRHLSMKDRIALNKQVTPPPGYLGPQQITQNPWGPIKGSFSADDAYLQELVYQNKLQAEQQDFRPIYGPISNVFRRGPSIARAQNLLRAALLRRNLLRRKTRSYYRRNLRRNTYTRRRGSYKDKIDKLCKSCT